jgi:hypothetical protein
MEFGDQERDRRGPTPRARSHRVDNRAASS